MRIKDRKNKYKKKSQAKQRYAYNKFKDKEEKLKTIKIVDKEV